jgi:hypothetical protein
MATHCSSRHASNRFQVTSLELVSLVPYLLECQGFNPIGDNLDKFMSDFEQVLEAQNFQKEQVLKWLFFWGGGGCLSSSSAIHFF